MSLKEIMDRFVARDAKGESERQARGDHKGSSKRTRKGFGHKRSARKRMASRMAR